MANWLEELKAGDEVAIRPSGVGSSYRLAVVEGATKLHVLVEGSKYRKNNGSLVTESKWCREYLEQPTAQIRDSIKRERLLSEINQHADRIRRDSRRIPTATLEQIVESLKQSQG